jgi:hypothetical protein
VDTVVTGWNQTKHHQHQPSEIVYSTIWY